MSVPVSLTNVAPMCRLACHRPTAAPVGSVMNDIRPASPMSKAGIITCPPPGTTLSTTASTSSTAI
ncbi:Uncharacterised protein [Mycobacterium tuberculosis]|nr:hypothetical protein RN08_0649 [Mycobacterium tuberculosis variant microti]CEZ68721.1 Uncharacterised protein [Mycobacterium tuberculosis]CFS48953.1 Uncharacterised protein [Mycobacterium tuberculosis]CKR01610.1 Uncharacterised protein [Mycobacterium tuberculosis]CKT82839.1 Uncharacterised protein [Mycobacterium tuberculosis]